MPADVPSLRRLCQDDATIAALMDVLPHSQIREGCSRVLYLRHLLAGKQGLTLDNHQMVAALRLLAGLGFGELAEAHRPHVATFRWHVEPRALAQAARDERLQLRPEAFLHPSAAPATPPAAETSPPVPEGWRLHRFPLRADGDALLVLPPDLTDREAERLGYLLRAHATG